MEEGLTTAYELAGTKFNHNKIVKIIKFLTNKRMVVQEKAVAFIGSCRITIIDFPLDFILKVSIRNKSKSKCNDWFHDNPWNWSLPLMGLPVVQTLFCMGSLIPQATNRSLESKSLSKLIGEKKTLFEPFIFSPAIGMPFSTKTKFVYLIAHRACPLYKPY